MNLEAKIDCQQGAVRAVRFNKDGNYCITCGNDKTVKLWNIERKFEIRREKKKVHKIISVFLRFLLQVFSSL